MNRLPCFLERFVLSCGRAARLSPVKTLVTACQNGDFISGRALCVAIILLSSPNSYAQRPAANPPEQRYEFRANHDINGIGKFYMGREIAQVMGHQGISWLERPEREQEEGLSLLIECLQVEPGTAVADIGAGSGVISTRLAKAVGIEGTVYAVDIQKQMLRALEFKCKRLGIENIQPVLGTIKSPQLDENSIDLVVMVDVYHEFDHPYEMLLEITKAVKPGGRVAFVEYRKEDRTIPIKEIHKMSEVQVKREASVPEMNLKWIETVQKLPRQHVILFEKVSPSPEADPLQ